METNQNNTAVQSSANDYMGVLKLIGFGNLLASISIAMLGVVFCITQLEYSDLYKYHDSESMYLVGLLGFILLIVGLKNLREKFTYLENAGATVWLIAGQSLLLILTIIAYLSETGICEIADDIEDIWEPALGSFFILAIILLFVGSLRLSKFSNLKGINLAKWTYLAMIVFIAISWGVMEWADDHFDYHYVWEHGLNALEKSVEIISNIIIYGFWLIVILSVVAWFKTLTTKNNVEDIEEDALEENKRVVINQWLVQQLAQKSESELSEMLQNNNTDEAYTGALQQALLIVQTDATLANKTTEELDAIISNPENYDSIVISCARKRKEVLQFSNFVKTQSDAELHSYISNSTNYNPLLVEAAKIELSERKA